MRRAVNLSIIMLSVVFTASCSKKEEPAPPPSPTDSQQQAHNLTEQMGQSARQTTEAAKEAVTEAVEKVKQTFTTTVDLDKSVSALKAEAEQMDIPSLREVAGKYKDAMVAKQDEIKSLTEKLNAVPLTQKLGQEAQQITTDLQGLTQSLSALKERFDVYVAAIKDKGGDVGDLSL